MRQKIFVPNFFSEMRSWPFRHMGGGSLVFKLGFSGPSITGCPYSITGFTPSAIGNVTQ
jgi:hypothetical protein